MKIINIIPWGLSIVSLILIIILGIYLYILNKKSKIEIKKILIYGSNGKMGSFLVNNLNKYQIVKVDIEDNLELTLKEKPNLIIDFSTRDSSLKMIQKVLPLNIPIISGVTGYSLEELNEIYDNACKYHTSIIIKPNFSEGINYIINNFNFEKNDSFECYIDEYHHITKKDSPSGTSKLLSRIFDIKKINSHRIDDYQVSHEIVLKNDYEEVRVIHNVFRKEAYLNEINKSIELISKGFIIDINY